MSYDSWKLATPPYYDLPEIVEHCKLCTEPHPEGEPCTNEHCHCQECGEPLPELPAPQNGEIGHCENCCECAECVKQWRIAYFMYKETGEWADILPTAGEKVYTQ